MLEHAVRLQKNMPEIRQFMVVDYSAVYSSESHREDFHELAYILDGRVILHLEKNQQFNAGPGDFLLIPAHTDHRDEFTLRQGLRVLYIKFKWDEEEFFKRVNSKTLINLDYDIINEVRRRLEFMRSYWEETPEGIFHGACQLHGILLLLYFGAVNAPKDSKHGQLPMQENMIRAMHFIKRNYASQISLDDVANFVGMNTSYFSRQFSCEFGVNFSTYLTAIRMDMARYLLLDSSKQVAEIASLCGFSSSGYFIKVFRKHFGMTPKIYAESERHKVKRNM